MLVAINVSLFQAGWFACVLGAAHGHPLAGAAVALAIAAGWVWYAPRPQRELALVVVAISTGLALDTLLARSGLIEFASMQVATVAPVWMLSLWALFAVTLNVSLRWLRDRPGLAAVLGGIGGPAAYYAGAELGALRLVHAGAGMLATGAGWALAAPLLAVLARRLEGRG